MDHAEETQVCSQSCIDSDDCGVVTMEKMGYWSSGSLIALTVLPGGSSVVE